MAERRTLNEEKLRQCFAFFQREIAHWERLTAKRIEISLEEFTAKREIIEAVHQVAAVAAIDIDNQAVSELRWNFGELEMTMTHYRRIMDI